MTMATWTPERLEQLRNFAGSGLSSSRIAAEIGVTRNAVIGKLHRLGLAPGRPAAGGPARPPPAAFATARISAPDVRADAVDRERVSRSVDGAEHATVFALRLGA
jgi:hypothetical protein